ncbi:unnamed protein product, partial [Choristocarpus tenellus]
MATVPDLDHFDYREYEEFYEPREDTYLLIDALQEDADQIRNVCPNICLEIGPGSGAVIAFVCSLLRDGEGKNNGQTLFLAADINPQAAEASLRTARANKVEPYEVVCCDLALCMTNGLQGRVDILLFNPPYVPTPSEEVGSMDIASAWAGGNRGREVIDRFLPHVKAGDLLSRKGYFYLVVVEENVPEEIMKTMTNQGMEAKVILRNRAKNEMLSVIRIRWPQEPREPT